MASEDNILQTNALAVREYIHSQPQDALLNSPWAVYQALDLYSRTACLMNFKQAKLNIAQEALMSMETAPKIILEFGTYIGCSAIAWAAILRDLHGASAEGLHVYTFEVSETVAEVARDLIRVAGVEDIVHVIVGPASESLKQLVEEGKVKEKGVDMAFFDHWEKFYLSDLQLCEDLGLFREGSRVIADNTDIPGAPDYLEYLRAGGRGGEGSVRYETKSVQSEPVSERRKPNMVEVSTVVVAP
ncbi:S-adenosyl-L-methionine-dependent methyltransferase [Aspergillus sclerotiicarbonarius CBS 121057]|uniref:catechol O-methyltransferase n=1 Tax=Aspergillus sclerotiicarbonarius (strain CBS 121057 / IBT 28362) TaxID=1448318 RepID=A0A319FLP0_ASPSB|nr:S-adenosyl-L-methionine-dependent methyltransferase [Aspergillus sclerotiicarbonarius CBS 121057]